MHAATAPAGFSPSLDVLPDLRRSWPPARDLVLPLALLVEFVSGLLVGFVV